MHKQIVVALLIAFTFATSAFAQKIANSPYSRFGLGDLNDRNLNVTRSMGGIGSSFTDPYHANPINPASYAHLYATAFDLGLGIKNYTLSEGDNSSNLWSGGFEYMSLSFPLRNPINESFENIRKKYRVGMNLGLYRNSTVNYNITGIENITDIGEVSKTYTGSGGTYRFLWGTGFKYNDFSIGANLGYLFGKISNDKQINFLEVDLPYNNEISDNYNVSGFLWNLGVMYGIILNKDEIKKDNTKSVKKITLGIRGNSATSFSTNSERMFLANQTIGSLVSQDTIYSEEGIEGKGKLPAELGLGINYLHGEKFSIGLDLSTAKWAKYHNDGNYENINSLKDAFRVSFGGYFRPDYKSFTNYYKRVFYRYGVYYDKDPRVVQGKQLDSYGLTFGFGLPFSYQRQISHANIGLDIGRSGANTIISENYIKLNIGFTFNDDQWFLKRKYN